MVRITAGPRVFKSWDPICVLTVYRLGEGLSVAWVSLAKPRDRATSVEYGLLRRDDRVKHMALLENVAGEMARVKRVFAWAVVTHVTTIQLSKALRLVLGILYTKVASDTRIIALHFHA